MNRKKSASRGPGGGAAGPALPRSAAAPDGAPAPISAAAGAATPTPAAAPTPGAAKRRHLYRQLYTIRHFESECIKLYRKGLIRGYFHPYLGEEAIAVGVCAALESRDYIVSTHRGHGHCIARGARLDRMVAELLGRESGYCRGRGGSMHIADFATGNLGANGIVGGGIPLGVGAALGSWIRGEDRVTVTFFSDGAVNNGVFGESLNLASIWDLPVIFVLENNRYAAASPIEEMSRLPDLYPRGEGYGIVSWGVDGNDVLAVYERTAEAVALCRNGKGPVLMEAKTYRHMGHHVNDPGAYMPQEELAYYKSEKDPVELGRRYLLEVSEEAEVLRIEEQVRREMEEAVAFAMASPEPSLQEFLAEVESCP
jgi:TPP-dependent pyruvate/acetoin dehydrogenase alpha subunit